MALRLQNKKTLGRCLVLFILQALLLQNTLKPRHGKERLGEVLGSVRMQAQRLELSRVGHEHHQKRLQVRFYASEAAVHGLLQRRERRPNRRARAQNGRLRLSEVCQVLQGGRGRHHEKRGV